MLQDKIFQEKNAKIPWLNTYQLGRALTKAGFTQVVVKDGGRALRVWKVKIRAIGRSVTGESEPAKVHELRSAYVQGANDAF